MDTLAKRLCWARQKHEWSQARLAKEAGLKSQSLIGNLEAGLRKSTTHLPRIAKALNVNALWLAEGLLTPDTADDLPLTQTDTTGTNGPRRTTPQPETSAYDAAAQAKHREALTLIDAMTPDQQRIIIALMRSMLQPPASTDTTPPRATQKQARGSDITRDEPGADTALKGIGQTTKQKT